MQLKTILNRVQKHSSFVYGEMRPPEGEVPELEVTVRPRANSRPECSGCVRRGSGYDRLPQRDLFHDRVSRAPALVAQRVRSAILASIRRYTSS